MVTDTIEHAASYLSLSPRIAVALRFLMRADRAQVPVGKQVIEGEKVFALVQEYSTKPRAECFWEAHRKYIDVQFVADGLEGIGWSPIDRMELVKPYDPERDLGEFEGEGQLIQFPADSFAIFWPHDVHMPSLAIDSPQTVRKIVVKVAVE